VPFSRTFIKCSADASSPNTSADQNKAEVTIFEHIRCDDQRRNGSRVSPRQKRDICEQSHFNTITFATELVDRSVN
jgi:hypothetical protein